MNNKNLFTHNNTPVSQEDVLNALRKVGANDASVLYIHSGLSSFGLPNPELSRNEILQSINEVFLELDVGTICMPTYTFSFCNGKDFDVQLSKSLMGSVSEYFRKMPDVIRSIDPLMSVAILGKAKEIALNLGRESIGADSSFDRLSKIDGVKFLFFGVELGDCFTYMHYLEWLAKVPYRYNRKFTGNVSNNGVVTRESYELFVRYNGVIAGKGSYSYGRKMEELNQLSRSQLGGSSVSCVSELDAKLTYMKLLNIDPNYFLVNKFEPTLVDKNFAVNNMVAL